MVVHSTTQTPKVAYQDTSGWSEGRSGSSHSYNGAGMMRAVRGGR